MRVLAIIFEVASAMWSANDVHSGGEQYILSVSACLAGHRRTLFAREVWVAASAIDAGNAVADSPSTIRCRQ